MSDDLMARDVAKLCAPVVLGICGYVGLALAKDDPAISPRRFAGGVITAGFVAWGVNTLLISFGLSPDMASVTGAVIGSQGPAGLYLLLNKVKKVFETK